MQVHFGTVCNKHHTLNGERRLDNNKCVGCCRDNTAAWRRANPEKAKAYSAAYLPKWLAANAEKMKVGNRRRTQEWRQRNIEKVRATANSPEMRAYRSALRAKEKRATPSWANAFFIKEAYELASLRTKMTGVAWHVDHIVPLQSKRVCGLHWEGNFQVITRKENSAKGNRHWPNM